MKSSSSSVILVEVNKPRLIRHAWIIKYDDFSLGKKPRRAVNKIYALKPRSRYAFPKQRTFVNGSFFECLPKSQTSPDRVFLAFRKIFF